MRSSKSIFFLFFLALTILIAVVGWSGYNLYQFEKERLKSQVDLLVKETAEPMFHSNVTLLNNMASMLTDEKFNEKVAFAAGFTQNMSSIGIYFDEDTVHDKILTKDAVKINKDFLRERHINYDPTFIKRPSDFDSVFHQKLDSSGLKLEYIIKKFDRFDSAVPKQHVASRPFMINPAAPKMYRVIYKESEKIILARLSPFIISVLLLVVLFTSGFVFYIRSYKLQTQMWQFKQSLFSNVTHELKTPVSSLQLIIDAARQRSDGRQALISDEHLQFANSEIERMNLNIDKILSFSKLNRDQFEVDKELLDLNEIIKHAISAMKVVLAEKDGQVLFKEEDTVNVLGDATLLVNVLVTIIDNAVKYNNQRPRVEIEIERGTKDAYISISDNGIGIPTSYKEKIFEPFFRVPTGDRHDVKGHGLGLSFVAQVMLLHHGSVSVSSAEEGGSSFIITIPTV